MTITKTIRFYSDPSHGWGKVARKELKDLGILSQISRCSYQWDIWVFLEEDCDLYRYIKAQKEQGIEVRFKAFHANKSSRIRRYPSFKYVEGE